MGFTCPSQYYLEKNLEARERELKREAELEEKFPTEKSKSKMTKVNFVLDLFYLTLMVTWETETVRLIKVLSGSTHSDNCLHHLIRDRRRGKQGKNRRWMRFKLLSRNLKWWKTLRDGSEKTVAEFQERVLPSILTKLQSSCTVTHRILIIWGIEFSLAIYFLIGHIFGVYNVNRLQS